MHEIPSKVVVLGGTKVAAYGSPVRLANTYTVGRGAAYIFSRVRLDLPPIRGGGGGGIYETGYVVFLATVHLRVFLATL